VDVHIRSEDVIHSFWVPRLAGKMDAIPGHVNVLRIQVDQPGVYRGVCAEFCGLEHATMSFEVRAHPGGDYANALREALEETRP
jgi:cytochrome c oxidase subunit 2